MQCNCGGQTKVERHPVVREKRVVRELELDVCYACGRVGGRRFYRVYGPYTKVLIARKD